MACNKKNVINTNTNLMIFKKKSVFGYTTRLERILLDISDNISFAIMGCHHLENNFDYKLLDLSDKSGTFKLHVEGKGMQYISVESLLNKLFNKKFNNREIEQFIRDYNKRIPTKDKVDYYLVDTSPYEKEKFIYRPNDILYTFNSLCYKTYPHGTEKNILKYIPIPLIEDNYGNYYIKVGESDTMFTSHFDSACRQHQKVRILQYKEDNSKFIISDAMTILSADDKAGVTIMLYMIENKIPGLYYFFLGEERGGIGSGMLAKEYHLNEQLNGINKCISFDRRNYHSVITHQGSARCCSDDFGKSLCDELNKNGMSMKLDNTGLFTDSANFTEYIPECTNISVGYFKEHTIDEFQNITFLEELCKACTNVKWDSLVVKKKAEANKEIIERNAELLSEFKLLKLSNETRMNFFEDRVFIEIKFDSSDFIENYKDINLINKVISSYYEDANVFFLDDYGTTLMNIEIL